MFAGYTAAQLGVGDVARTDRGAASAFYFSAYYATGALGAYLPGLAWERWGWGGILGTDALALGVAAVALASLGALAAPRGGRGRVGVLRSAAMPSRNREDHVLSRIISTVGSSLELDDVLAAVVELLSDASAVRACFVYLVDESGDRLVLRAAGEPYGHLVGSVAFARGESLAWWSLEHREPAFIREGALADPRTKEVPEFEEDRFQSLVAVPVLSRAGAEIGAITAHTEAPREFTDDEVAFLVTVARLVAGAIENARLYEETRRRVGELERLTALAEEIAQAPTRSRRSSRSSLVALASSSGRARVICTCSKEAPRSSSCRPRTRSASRDARDARSCRARPRARPRRAGDEARGTARRG